MDEDVKKAGVALGNGLEARGEGAGGPSNMKMGDDSANAVKPQEEPQNGFRMENPIAKSKSSKKLLIWVAVVVALLVIGGVVVWMLLSGQKGESVGDVGGNTVESGNDSGELVEVSVADDDVVRVMQLFRTSVIPDEPFVDLLNGGLDEGFYGTNSPVFAEGISDEWKIAMAMRNVMADAYAENRALECEVVETMKTVGELVKAGERANCVPLDKVQDVLKKMFGKGMDFEEALEVDESYYGMRVIQVGASMYAFSEVNGGFFMVGARGGYGGYLVLPYGALKSDEEMVVETAVAYSTVGPWCYVGQDDGISDGCRLKDVNGNTIEGIDVIINDEEELVDYLDKLDKFRWTFVKNEEGNYVFEGLEKVN